MAVKWSITPPIRDKILKKKPFKGVWNRTFAVMLALVILSLVCIFAFLRFSTKYMEDSISRSLEHSVEQRQINIDFRLRSMQLLDENLIATIYPYTYSGADISDQYTEYAELNALFSAYTVHEDISHVRLYISDAKVYSHQGDTYYPLSSLIQSPDSDAPIYVKQPGTHWLETHKVPLRTKPGGVLTYANVLTLTHTMRQRDDYDQIACVLMLDIETSKFDEILRAEDTPDCIGYLTNSDGICLASPDQSLIRETVIAPELMEQILLQESGCLTSGDRAYVYHRLDFNDWYLIMDYPASILSVANSAQGSVLQIMISIVI